MRTLEEMHAAVRQAMSVNDAATLLRLSDEMDADVTPEAHALASISRGVAYRLHGKYQDALEWLHRAMTQYQDLNNHASMASVAANIGSVYVDMGDFTKALEQYERALASYEERGDRFRTAHLMLNIGNLYRSIGNYPQALEQFHHALAHFEDLDYRPGIANVTGNLGNVYRATGNYPLALEHYYRALSAHELNGNRNGVAIVTSSIGNVYLNTGSVTQAMTQYQRSLALHEELGDRASAARVLGNIDSVFSASKDHAAALEYFQRALNLHEEHGDLSNLAIVKCSVVDALLSTGQYANAEARLNEMEHLEIDDPATLISRELHRAAIHDHHGLEKRAHETLQNALAQAVQYNIPEMAATIHQRLRDRAQKRNDLSAYIEHNNEFTRITEEINGKETATKLAMQEKQREIDAREREHAKHMAVLHSALPKHVADRVARGEVVNDSYDNAAVLFLDVVGFTTHSGALEASVVVGLLQNIFTTFDAICAQHDVMKIKTIGDSYMAVAFPSDRHLENLAAVALAMQASEFSWPHTNERVMFRIGLHCGPVVAGVLGTERMQYDVWGDTVNIASRMESAGEPGRVHVSEAFAINLGMNTEYRIQNSMSESQNQELNEVSLVTSLRGTIDIKGKGLMTTYWLS